MKKNREISVGIRKYEGEVIDNAWMMGAWFGVRDSSFVRMTEGDGCMVRDVGFFSLSKIKDSADEVGFEVICFDRLRMK